MAIILNATARLNGGPFLKTLGQITAATKGLNTQVVKGNKTMKDGALGIAQANEQVSRSVRNVGREVAATSAAGSRSLRQLATDTDRANRIQRETAEINRRIQDGYRTMSMAQARHNESQMRSVQQRLALQRALADGIEGPALQKYYDKVHAAETAQAKTRRALNNETAKLNAASVAQAAAATQVADATRKGTDAADAYTRRLASMSPAQLAVEQSSRRLQQAQMALTTSMARSGGAITADTLAKQRAYGSALASHNKLIEAQAAAQSQLGKGAGGAATGLAAQRYMYHDMSRQLAGATLALAAFPAMAYGVSAAWERVYADVARTADPDFSQAPHRLEALRSSLVGMAQAMPASFGAIAEIATLANQMGIASAQTAEFTRAVTMFSATSGVSVDMAATAFGRLTSIMGDSRIGFVEMADSILKVGVNSVATEAEIINITTQISSIAQQAGMTTQDIIGLSGALASVRVPPELSRGVITRVFGQIDKAVNAGGTGLQQLARISGVTAEEFRSQWGTEASGNLFNDFMRGLRDAGSAARSELNALGITSVRDVPVMLRLANAADSEGNVGELFTQTLRDANHAAGETQRQYTIMAETVVSKLKVLGNNILAFFDAAGRTSLGGFGNVVETLSKSLRNLTRSLDEPHALLGVFGQTNSDVIGLTMNIGLLFAGFTLVGSALAKVGAAWATLRNAGAVISTWSIFGGGGAGSKAGGIAAFAGGADKAARSAGKLRGAIGGMAGFLNPWTIAIGAGVTILSALNSNMEKGVTNANALAESLSGINLDVSDSLDRVLGGVSSKGLWNAWTWDKNVNPFEGGVDGYRAAVKEILDIREANQYEWFGGTQTFELGQWVDRLASGSRASLEGIATVDEAIQSMSDGGNSVKALRTVEKLAATGKDLQEMLTLDEMGNTRHILENAFALADIEMTSEALEQFTRGTLHELYDAMTGVAGSSLVADELFEGDFERLGQFAAAFDEAAASFINFEEALSAGTLTNESGDAIGFDLSAWTDSMGAQIEAQENWFSNITEIAKHGSTDVIEALAEMGPAGQLMAEELAAGLAAGEPVAIAALEMFERNVAAEAAGLGNTVAELLANIDWLRGASPSDEIFNQLISDLDDADVTRLREAGAGLSRETLQGILEGLADTGDINAALREMELAQPRVVVSVEFKDEAVDRGIAAVQAKLQKANPEATVTINTETTVGQLRKMLNDPLLNELPINADLTLTEAYAKSREFQVWAAEQGIDVLLGANDLPARLTLQTLIAYAERQEIQTEIHALPKPEGLWELVTLANGTRGYIQLDAENQLALEKVWQVDAATGQPMVIDLTADETEAINKVLSVRTKAESNPAVINVTALDNATRDINWIARNREATVSVVYKTGQVPAREWHAPLSLPQADGGVVSYYANGAVRESHTAQIAPAGAMRVWAEPETGGEAYIPLAKSKRLRSEAILADVANRFGMVLQPKNYKQFADGGYYAEQMASRYRNSFTATRGTQTQAGVHIGSVAFTQAEQKDQFREFTRTLNRYERSRH